MRFSAAEGALGATALVLVIWLLWPEGSTPKLDQQATWQQHLRDAERKRSEALAARRPVLKAEIAVERQENPNAIAKRVRKRSALAKPSELADRYKAFGNRPAATPVARGGWPEQARPEDVSGEGPGDPAGAARTNTATTSRGDQAIPDGQAGESSTSPDELSADIEVTVYSTEALDAEINPDRLLGDPQQASSIPSPDGFDIESLSSSHVRQRPRDDAPSWLKNAVAASLIDDRPVISVVIDDLGLNRVNTKALNDLPAPLTLAFLPYAGNIEAQTEAARLAGHELMVHLPMEPFGSAWPGPEALITSLDHDEFVKRLDTNLNRIEGYVGVNNHMGSRLTSDRGRMDLVMRELRERDVLFLDSKTSPGSVASEMASRNGVPNTIRDVFLDHVIDIGKIRAQMSLVERIARQRGSAVAIGHPHAATIEALSSWLPRLADRGFVLAPISAVVARRACNSGLLIAAKTCGLYLQAQKPDAPTIAAGGG